MKHIEQYQDMIARLFPELCSKNDSGKKNLSRVVTFQVTDECNLSCSYCYQINKGTRKMKFEDAKKLIDMLLTNDPKLDGYVSVETSPAIILEFIGGEPFLAVELIEQICDYFMDKAIELCHPWASRFCISICSNGTLYFDPKVQHFLNKFRDHMSFSVTIDGNKELHDACRVFPDGSPSYDLAIAAANDWMEKGYEMGSKITIAPDNLSKLYEAITHMVDLGYDEINANCVYEKGWTLEHATEFYYKLKQIADYWIDNNIVETHYLSLFEENFFKPKKEDDLENWCFAEGTFLEDADYRPFPIEQAKPGMMIRSGSESVDVIEEIRSGIVQEIYLLQIKGCPVTYVTGEHPYRTKKGFVPVRELTKGDKVLLERNFAGEHDEKIPRFLAYSFGVIFRNGTQGEKPNNFLISMPNGTFDQWIYRFLFLSRGSVMFQNICFDTVNGTLSLYINEDDAGGKYLLKLIGEAGLLTPEKPLKIPEDLFGWDMGLVGDFIDGLLELVYNSSSITRQGENYFYIVQKENPELEYSIMALMRKATIYGNSVKLADGETRIEYNKPCNRFDELIPEGERLALFSENLSINDNIDFDGDWAEITMIRKINEPFIVYDIRMSGSRHTFVANGAIVHNCGGTGYMLSMDPDGYLYPCIRYMESSLGSDREPLRIGHVDEGIGQTTCTRDCINCLNAIDRRTESTDECFYCPLAEGCSWCSAYNYQVFGTPDSRATYICEMHKARALANVYFWNKWYRKNNINKRFKNYCPDNWALAIIPQEELDMLKELEGDV